MKFSEDKEKQEKRNQAIEILGKVQLDVGLTSESSARSKMLLAIHEHGSPIMNIPARPVVAPALENAGVKKEMSSAMVKACKAASEGDEKTIRQALEEAGQAGVDGIHEYIDAGVPPPNAPITLSGGWMWNKVSHKPFKVEGKSGSKPLVDTGQLYGDFHYEIKER